MVDKDKPLHPERVPLSIQIERKQILDQECEYYLITMLCPLCYRSHAYNYYESLETGKKILFQCVDTLDEFGAPTVWRATLVLPESDRAKQILESYTLLPPAEVPESLEAWCRNNGGKATLL